MWARREGTRQIIDSLSDTRLREVLDYLEYIRIREELDATQEILDDKKPDGVHPKGVGSTQSR